MEWLTDPSAWVGLLTLVVLEVVLGIDNLIFIAILVDKLSPEQADRARKLGLSMALVMRLALLASISWVMSLTAPVLTVLSMEVSWRDMILISGGLFLLIKATMEIHDRLEATAPDTPRAAGRAAFWPVVAQIVVLDAVFSLDSIVTAVGMVDELYVMMVAVVISVVIMLFASKPLGTFVNAHPSLVILCLGFLLMVGFTLVVDGFGVHIPKGYLYAAIGFSVLIEALNQLALRNRKALEAKIPLRHRAAQAVLRLVGGVPFTSETPAAENAEAVVSQAAGDEPFAPAEQEMMRGVLSLADRTVQTIMTPRVEVEWVDLADSTETQLATIRSSPHRRLVVSRDDVDQVAGIVCKDEVLEHCMAGRSFDLRSIVTEAMVVHESLSILKTIELFKRQPGELALVVDEYGGLQGIATRSDVLKAIAGNLLDAKALEPSMEKRGEEEFLVHGGISLSDAQSGLELQDLPSGPFVTFAGFVVSLFGRMPQAGDGVAWNDWHFEVFEMDGLRIRKVLARRCTGSHRPNSADRSSRLHATKK